MCKITPKTKLIQTTRSPLSRPLILLFLFCVVILNARSIDGKQKTYRFGVLSSRTLLGVCNDTASSYMAEQGALGHNVIITCYSTELAAQLGVIQARDIPTVVNTPVITSNGKNATAADVDFMTIFLLRTIFTSAELNNNSDRFVAYPVLVNGAVVGYNLPDLEPGNIGGLDAKADPVVLRLSQAVITGTVIMDQNALDIVNLSGEICM